MAKKKGCKLPDKIRLYVGKCDIKKGIQCQADACPIALALRRKFTEKVEVLNGFYESTIGKEKYNICKIGSNFIRLFDHGQPVQPTKVIFTKIK